MNNLISLQELKMIIGEQNVSDEKLEFLIEYCSAILRKVFKDRKRDLDEEIKSGDLADIIVKNTICEMISQNLNASELPFGGAYNNYSENAGGYSVSISGNQKIYISKNALKLLGIGDLYITSFQMF